MKKLFLYLASVLEYAAAFAASFFVKNRPAYRDLWIIAERGTDARDNAYHLFKYIRENHPEINIAYIISRDSADRGAVEPLGRIIDGKSFEHYIAMVLSKVKISTHIMGCSPIMNLFIRLNRLGLVSGKQIFLQHGIIVNDNRTYLYYGNTRADMFVCSAKPEFEYINGRYGYPEGAVRLLGLCRYDRLEKRGSLTRRILLMPTWRVALQDCNEKEFTQSAYYKAYQSLINSEKMSGLLEKYGLELVFYPHIEMQKYLPCFSTNCGRVKIAGFNDETVQNLLIKSDILITDYSSVFFDYGYMEKPMVYYQFDVDEFRKTHYGEGYFSYERDGFGRVVDTEDALIGEIEKILQNNSEPEKIYLDRINGFFTIRDRNNCKRNFEAICEIAGGA